MIIKRFGSTVAVLACIAAPIVVGVAPAYAGIVIRYASPTGSGTACSEAEPCNIVTAVNDGPGDTHVALAAGSYGSAKHPITTKLMPPTDTDIAPAVDGQPVVIYLKNDGDGLLVYGSEISHLTLITHTTTSGLALLDGSSADHVAVFNDVGSYGACSVYTSGLTDSLCAETGDSRPAIGISESGTGLDQDVFENVTAVATGKESFGLSASESGGVSLQVTAANTIFTGTQGDLRTNASAGSNVIVTLQHSDVRTAKTVTTGSTINRDASDISAKPKFIDAKKLDFREKPTSPTVDAGALAIGADTDLAGLPRTLGASTDIGAFEFPQPPVLKHFKAVSIKRRKATFSVSVNGEGLNSRTWLVAKTNGHTITSPKVTVKATAGVQTVQLTLHGLPKSAQHVHARARSKAGVGTKTLALHSPPRNH